jgi:hypothetical protein
MYQLRDTDEEYWVDDGRDCSRHHGPRPACIHKHTLNSGEFFSARPVFRSLGAAIGKLFISVWASFTACQFSGAQVYFFFGGETLSRSRDEMGRIEGMVHAFGICILRLGIGIEGRFCLPYSLVPGAF